MSVLTDTITDGPFLLAAGLSVAAGAVSFASPCVLPLVPGYLSYLASLVGAETAVRTTRPVPVGGPGAAPDGDPPGGGPARTPNAPDDRRRMARVGAAVRSRAVGATALFVAGFTVVFVLQSVVVLGLTRLVAFNQDVLLRVGGVITIVVGLAMLGLFRPLQVERRLHLRPTGRLLGPPLLGATFALGWTACLGPTLVGVQALAITTDWGPNAWRGLALVVLYCAGLGIPFLLLAFGFGWAAGAVAVLRRHSRTVQVVGALALVLLGILMVTGAWGTVIAWLQNRVVVGTESVL